MVAQGLPGHQEVVGSNGFARSFECRSECAGGAGVGLVERKDENRPGQKGFKPFAVEILLCALRDTVPEFEERDRGHQNMCCGSGCFLQVTADGGWMIVDQGNTGVGIEQVVHLNLTPQRPKLVNFAAYRAAA